MNINLPFQTMKRGKCQRKAGSEEEEMDSSELAEKIYCTLLILTLLKPKCLYFWH